MIQTGIPFKKKDFLAILRFRFARLAGHSHQSHHLDGIF